MRNFAAVFLLLVVSITISLGSVPVTASASGNVDDPGPLGAPVIISIPSGASAKQISTLLEEEGAIASALVFQLYVRITGKSPDLKAGEYEIPARASAADIIDILTSGRSINKRVTFPEGMTVLEIIDQLNAVEDMGGEITNIPVEGTLFPNTYYYSTGQDRGEIIAKMEAAMEKELDRLWAERQPDLPFDTKDEALILASVVERETAIVDESPVVASVYINRLRIGMRLQADPTVIYGLSDGYGKMERELLLSDLRKPSPYNTYLNEGLPPTAIANPGLRAVEAVLNPAATEYLFFVADGTGGHVFAKTYEEHKANVAEWREIKKQRRAEQGN